MAKPTLRRRSRRNRPGQGLVEYILVLALVAVGLILVAALLRDEIGSTVDGAGVSLEVAPAGQYVPGGGTTVSSPGGGASSGRGNGRGRGRGAGGVPPNGASASQGTPR
jgi:Flp pilus assembly pilin Flp